MFRHKYKGGSRICDVCGKKIPKGFVIRISDIAIKDRYCHYLCGKKLANKLLTS